MLDAPASSTAPQTPKERDIFGREPVGYPDWSHRRAEPRVFALLWMLFLMSVTVLMFASLRGALTVSPSITRPAARAMLLTAATGVALFWPVVRLCQEPAERPALSAMRDIFVVFVSAQAVVWPHALRVLAWWPVDTLIALSLCLGAWSMVVGGLIACADAGRGAGRARWAWTLVVFVVALAAPVMAVARQTVGVVRLDLPHPGWMLSPLTAVLELTRDRTAVGPITPVSGAHWRAIAATACVGGALLLLAQALHRAGVASRRRGA